MRTAGSARVWNRAFMRREQAVRTGATCLAGSYSFTFFSTAFDSLCRRSSAVTT